MNHKAVAIIPAAGFGTRMRTDQPKQYLSLCNIPILVHTVLKFLSAPCISSIIVVVPADHLKSTREMFCKHSLPEENITLVPGGRRRQDSVKAGLDQVPSEFEIVMVHDGARPLVEVELIERCCRAAADCGAVIAAVPVKDTIKKSSAANQILATVDRQSLWQAQTPQAMHRVLLAKAFALNGDADVTDEASLLEKAGIPVQLIPGKETNLKITRPEDLVLAEKIVCPKSEMKIRIGHGYDAHRFSTDRELILGGIAIPHSKGLAGHSDADVLTHALCDALLGAMGKGDIGKHFPDTDKSFHNIYSIKLLEQVIGLVEEQGMQICNIDMTIICQAPRLSAYLDQMRSLLSQSCRTDVDNINIKATTTEKMGFTGREEGISSHAVVLLQRR